MDKYAIYNIQNESRLFDEPPLFYRQNIQDRLEKKSEFIVEEGDLAFILVDGVRQETLNPGRYEIFGKHNGLAGIFDKKRRETVVVLYISDNFAKAKIKWGIPHTEMMARDEASGVDMYLAAFGEMIISVGAPEKFYQEWLSKKKLLDMQSFQELILPDIKSALVYAIKKTIKDNKIPYHEFSESKKEIGDGVLSSVSNELMDMYGIKVNKVIISNIVIEDNSLKKLEIYHAEQKEKSLRQEEKSDFKEVLAEVERLNDKDWEKEKYLHELKSKDYEKYLFVSRSIGWENKDKDKKHEKIEGGGFCPGCGTPYEKGDMFCSKCARKLLPDTCSKCNKTLPTGAAFCSACGTPANKQGGN